MKKTALSALAAITILTGCHLKDTPKVPYEEPVDPTVEVDSAFYGYCGRGSTLTNLVIINNASQDTMRFNVEEARRNKRILGEYSVGDQLYVVPNADRSAAVCVVNENMLLHEWVTLSPYDGSSLVGINIKSGGDAESIDQIDLNYSRWSIINGRLLLTETREDASDIEITQRYDIVRLTSDSLYLNNVDEEETFEYTVKKYEPEEDLGIKLDYDTEEDYSLF
jgi:hypothetical protein